METGLAHVDADPADMPLLFEQLDLSSSRLRLEDHLSLRGRGRSGEGVGSGDDQAVAGDLRFAAVVVPDAELVAALFQGCEKEDAVRSETEVAVTYPQSRVPQGRERGLPVVVDDQKVIAGGLKLIDFHRRRRLLKSSIFEPELSKATRRKRTAPLLLAAATTLFRS